MNWSMAYDKLTNNHYFKETWIWLIKSKICKRSINLITFIRDKYDGVYINTNNKLKFSIISA